MLGKQLLYLLAITATLSTLAIQFNNQSALAISAEEVVSSVGEKQCEPILSKIIKLLKARYQNV